MSQHISRRTLLKGATAGAAAAAVALPVSKASRTFAAPNVVQSTGSTVKIVYWGSFTAENGAAEKEVVKRFNDSQKDVQVEYQFQGSYEETAQKLTAALAAQQAPDVSLLSDVWWFKFYLAKAIIGLSDLIESNKLDASDYVEGLWNDGVRDNVQYWIPFARSTPLFYYNKDAWQEAGLEDRGPKNWDEFQQWVPKLMKKEGNKTTRYAFGHPNGASYAAWIFQPVDWQWGGAYSDQDFNITIAEEKSVAAGNFYRSSAVDGWAGLSDDHVRDFNSGLWAAIMASTGSMAGIKKNNKFKEGFGTAFLPEGPAGFGCCTGGSGLSILSGSSKEKQEAAFKYVAFASSPEITTYWAKNTGYMPVRKSAVQSEEMQQYYKENPNFKTAVDQLPKVKPQDAARVFIPNGDQIIGKGLERIAVNKEEVQPVFDDLKNTLTKDAQPIIEKIKEINS